MSANATGKPNRLPKLLQFPAGKAGAVAIVRLLLIAKRLAEVWELPEITNWEPEYRFPHGIADFVLFHVDRSATVIVLKDAGSDRDILAGIGQLTLYAMHVKAAVIRRILAVAVAGKGNEHLLLSCALAGVQFEALGTMQQHRDVIHGIAA